MVSRPRWSRDLNIPAFRRNYFRASYLIIYYANHTPKYSDKKEKTRNTLVNAKRPMRTPEGHFVPFAGHSSKSGFLGNGHSNGCINAFFFTQRAKGAHYFHRVVGLEVINIRQWMLV